MTTPDPTLYRRAAEVIRTHGHAKGTYADPTTGGRCTIGAMLMARREDHLLAGITQLHPEIRHLATMLGHDPAADRTEHPGFAAVTLWNDAEHRTPEEAITLLEQAAEKVEADQ